MTYRFGIFAFDDRAALLTRSERPVALEPQPARALALLLARAGELVTREELRAHLWRDDTTSTSTAASPTASVSCGWRWVTLRTTRGSSKHCPAEDFPLSRQRRRLMVIVLRSTF